MPRKEFSQQENPQEREHAGRIPRDHARVSAAISLKNLEGHFPFSVFISNHAITRLFVAQAFYPEQREGQPVRFFLRLLKSKPKSKPDRLKPVLLILVVPNVGAAADSQHAQEKRRE